MDAAPRLPYRDRREAGQVLARHVARHFAQLDQARDLLVLALPRGGVPVAFEVARALGAPLDLFIVRKLGWPGNEEYAIGAIASGGVVVWTPEARGVSQEDRDALIDRETNELRRRERQYRGDLPPLEVEGRTVIVVDDGLATGASVRAAVQGLRALKPSCIVVAVPVGPRQEIDALRSEVDDLLCPATPSPFRAVGCWYRDFAQTSDEEVRALMGLAQDIHPAPAH